MPLEDLRTPLRKLLRCVTLQKGIYPARGATGRAPFVEVRVPDDLPGSGTVPGGNIPLVGDALPLLLCCRDELFAECKEGELEHLPERTVEAALDRLIAEAWIRRRELKSSDLSAMVDAFVATNRREAEPWDVLWEIAHLTVEAPFMVAGVEFVSFAGETVQDWGSPDDHPWSAVDQELAGRAFARARVRSGAAEKALQRAALEIDEALNVLRVVLRDARLIPERQRLQKRGLHYYARPVARPIDGQRGGRLGFEPIDLGIGGSLFEHVQSRSGEYGAAFDPRYHAGVREPLARALIWIGDSMARANTDDRVVGLCTALECILARKRDGLKAEAIAVRYMLLGYAVDDPTYVTHPLEIYDLYLLRNDVVHGAARRICDAEDVNRLQYVALDAVDRFLTLMTASPGIGDIDALFAQIESQDWLEKVTEFVEGHNRSHEAVRKVGGLAREWLARTREAGTT